MIDIIIPVLNNPQWLSMCLTALRAHTKNPYQIILIDNGCNDETRRLIDLVAVKGMGAKVVNHDNSSFSSSCNLGIAAGTNPYICLLNSDVIVTDNWDTLMLADMADPTCGLTGARTNAGSGWMGDPNSWTLGMRLPNDQASGRSPLSAPYLVFLCVMGRREVFDKVGPLDPKFGWGGNEDLDYSWRVEKAGYKCLISHAYVLHGCSKTFEIAHDPNVRSKNDIAAREHLIQKHGVDYVNRKLTLKRPKLAIGLLSRTEMTHKPFAQSLIGTITTLAINHGWMAEVIWATRTHTPLAREKIAQQALEVNADYLLFIDDDQTFTANDVITLLMAQKPVIAGTVYMRVPPYRTCVFKWANEADQKVWEEAEKANTACAVGLQNQEGIEGRGVIEVDAVGFGFVMINMDVFRRTPKPWFTWAPGRLGEDMTFCLKAKQYGARIYAHTDIDIGHMGDPGIINRESRQGWINQQAALGSKGDPNVVAK